jgi:RND family efflux transporter MFP subunit
VIFLSLLVRNSLLMVAQRRSEGIARHRRLRRCEAIGKVNSEIFQAFNLVLAVFVSALVVVSCSRPEHDPRVGPPLVFVAQVSNPAARQREYTGIVVARVQSDLGFRISGKITERLVDTGQKVSRGQALMRIDRTDYVLEAAAREGAVKAARARALQTAADEKRCLSLVSVGAISVSAYDLAKATADSAAADFRAAEAQLDVARRAADYSVLTADADGVIVETLGEPGQVVMAGQTMVRLAHSGPREAKISLPEGFRPAIGSSARARLYARPQPVDARLRQISSEADAVSRTFEARYVLLEGAADAPLGETVAVYVSDSVDTSATQVPWSALYDSGAGPGVWIVEGRDPKVTWKPVTIAGFGNEFATLSAGLTPGEQFVTVGAHLLHEGEHVRVGGPQDWTK